MQQQTLPQGAVHAEQDEPVNIWATGSNTTANRATYTGNARLQEDTTIKARQDRAGRQNGQPAGVRQSADRHDADRSGRQAAAWKPAAAKPAPKPTEPTPVDELLYEDRRPATYTGSAHMSGPNGDVTATRSVLPRRAG
jgi:hypothetical protein